MYMQLIKKNIYTLILLILFASSNVAAETFLSLKKSKVNVRYGPSFDSDIKFVYKKINLPVKQIDKKENFRRIIDLKNNSGWIHISQLKKVNSVIALKDKIMFKKPTVFSKPIAKIEKGRLLIIQNCDKKWCKVKTNDSDSLILSLFSTNSSANKNNSNSPLLSLNFIIAKGVPLALFFSCIDIIVPATRASLLLFVRKSL